MSVTVPEKRYFPLKNPPSEKAAASASYPCKYCKYSSSSSIALSYHLSHYHEEQLAAEGNKSLRERGDKWHDNYIEVYWIGQDWPTPTPEQWRRGEKTVTRLYELMHPNI